VPYAITDIDALTAPDLPPLCDGEVLRARLWVVFSSAHCQSCRELLRGLRDAQESVRDLGVHVVQYLVDVESCSAARRESLRAGHWPAGLAPPSTAEAWGVEETPLTFFIESGQVHSALHGSAPATLFVAEQLRIDRSQRESP
jgi:hypothetical protein